METTLPQVAPITPARPTAGRTLRLYPLVAAIVVIDQVTKWLVKTLMYPQQSIPVVGDLFNFTFTENPGMAFGMSVGSKLFLSVFSVVATLAIAWYLTRVKRAPTAYRVALALILAGAFGNVIDRVFYGVFWGYAPLFYGNVVDFLHLDVWRGFIPDAIPLIGGRYVALFPIGNVADLAIMGGVVAFMLVQKKAHDQMQAAYAAPASVGPPVGESVAPAPTAEGPPAV